MMFAVLLPGDGRSIETKGGTEIGASGFRSITGREPAADVGSGVGVASGVSSGVGVASGVSVNVLVGVFVGVGDGVGVCVGVSKFEINIYGSALDGAPTTAKLVAQDENAATTPLS